jgi:beta-glucosidase
MWSAFEPYVPRVAADDLEIASRPIDFLGVNYYSRALVKHQEGGFLDATALHPEGQYTAMDWEVYPQGLTDLLVRLHQDYAPGPLYITENGCAYEDQVTPDKRIHDQRRVAYLRAHFAAAHRAMAQGVPLAGYFVWSLMDNFEWALGYGRRFGIVYVDYSTLERIPKDSYLDYRTIIAQNGLEA